MMILFLFVYRRKYYTISRELIENKPVCHIESIINSVHHVIIEDEKVINNCSKCFPNATELTFQMDLVTIANFFASYDFHRMIPVAQLTKLTIKNIWNADRILNMLLHTPNIHTLVLTMITLYGKDILSIQKRENFRLVSKQNKIKNVTISFYSLSTIKILMKLCSELQHLTLGEYQQPFEGIIPFLLSKADRTTCHLSSLCILKVDAMGIMKLKTLVKLNKCIEDYLLKIVNDKFYLWW